MFKVLLADDHPVVRSGLQTILAKDPNLIVVGAVEDGRRAISFLRSNPCDVVVLDITMPDINGLVVTEHIKREDKKTKILILSIHKEEMYALRAFKAQGKFVLPSNTCSDCDA